MNNEFLELMTTLHARVRQTQYEIAGLTKQPRISVEKESVKQDSMVKDVLTREETEIYTAIAKTSKSLADSYLQVKFDIRKSDKISWIGTAHEIREVLSTMLRILAPDTQVLSQKWYVQEPNTSGPTQKQRVRYVLQQHNAGSKEREVAEQVAKLEDMIGDMVRAIYSRASNAAHTSKTKKEVLRIIKYFDVFAHDLLNIE